MKLRMAVFALTLLGVVVLVSRAASAQFGRQPSANSYPVTCESNDEHYRTCPTQGAVARVELQRQMSGSPCTFNRSWGFSSSGIWVDRGCRAVFTVYPYETGFRVPVLGGVWGHNRTLIKCESNDEHRRSCPVNDRVSSVEVYRQISGSPCTLNRSFGWSEREVWVDRGCRAEFTVYTGSGILNAGQGGGGFGRNQQTANIKCESDDEDYRFCPIANVRSARLVRQISGSPCTETQSWGWRNDGIWVDRGCRAEFEVRVRGR